MQEEIKKIQELHQKDQKAAKEKNLEVLVSLCTNDCVMLPPDEDPIIGIRAIKEWIRKNLALQEGYEITEYSQNFEEIKVIGNWAFEWGTFSGSARLLTGGPEIQSSGKIFRMLQRQPDKSWKVARSIWANDSPDGIDE
jgi:ketosteroid isomerase-like protein